jgi:hypothetical protein
MCSANCREQIATQKGTLYDTLQCKSIDFVEDHFADAAFKSGSGVTERQASRYSYGFVIVVVSLSPFQKKKKKRVGTWGTAMREPKHHEHSGQRYNNDNNRKSPVNSWKGTSETRRKKKGDNQDVK